jgi:hypothetical protein
MRSSQAFSMTWILVAALCPKNSSRSSRVVADTGQMQPRGQSRGNQNIGACRVSTAHTSGGASGFVAGTCGRNRPREESSLKCHKAKEPSPSYGGAGSRASRCAG